LDTKLVPYREGVDIADGALQWCGSWLHEIGFTRNSALDANKRRVVAAMLAPHLADFPDRN
jgi:hypothetical protein